MSSDDTPGQDAARPDSAATTPWRSVRNTPVREFVRTETGSAALLVAAIVAALVWVAMVPEAYERFWSTPIAFSIGDAEISQDLRGWVNTGLMPFFFLVIGLE